MAPPTCPECEDDTYKGCDCGVTKDKDKDEDKEKPKVKK